MTYVEIVTNRERRITLILMRSSFGGKFVTTIADIIKHAAKEGYP